MITVERLADKDFASLGAIEEGFRPDPKDCIAIVAKYDGEVIGRLMLLPVCHVEGAWVQERFRGGTILERMTRELEKQAKECGISTVFVYSQDLQMDSYIERLGYDRTTLRVFRKDL